MGRLTRALLLLTLVLTSGCATYFSRIRDARLDFERGQFPAAEERLKQLADKHDNDELLYVMELGTVQHTAGHYQDAIRTFLRADKLAEIKDYTSISAEAGSVLLNDDVKQYKGEDFEQVLISVYLALDYTMVRQWDDALVECRRVNEKLDRFISQGKKPYEYNKFAKYLSASLFEARGEYNDAWVDYRTLVKWHANNFPYLAAPLLRITDKLQALEELDEYRKLFPKTKHYRLSPSEGQILVVVEQGKAPYKVPSPQFNLIPIFHRNSYITDHAIVRVDGDNGTATYPLYDIERTAIKELDDKAAAIIAKKLSGVVVKEAAAYGVERATKSPLLGFVTSIALHATDHADLRSWTSLPATLQLARITVPAGRHDVSVDMVTHMGGEIKGAKRWKAVQVDPGQIVFLDYRSLE